MTDLSETLKAMLGKAGLEEAEAYGIDVAKRARAYRRASPEASPEVVANAVRIDIVEAGVDDIIAQKRRMKASEETRRELEERIKKQDRRVEALAKATAGTSQLAGAEASAGDDQDDRERTIEKEKEVFTR